MEFITLADVRRAITRDPDSGSFVNPEDRVALGGKFVRLYDPSGLDGEGKPRTSVVAANQALAALAKGFTENPPASVK